MWQVFLDFKFLNLKSSDIGFYKSLAIIPFLGLSACNQTQTQTSPDRVETSKIFAELCSSCHGHDMSGGMAPSLLDTNWSYGNTDEDLAKNISDGIENAAMPAFGDALTKNEIDGLVQYIRQSGTKYQSTNSHNKNDQLSQENTIVDSVTDVRSLQSQVDITDYIIDVNEPWGFAFIDSQSLLFTEKNGGLYLVEDQRLPIKINGTPTVFNQVQGGMLDVILHPNYLENKWVYLSYAEPLSENNQLAMTKVVRGRVEGNNWLDHETIFEANSSHYVEGGRHFGGRLAFDSSGHLYFSIGDRGLDDNAQDLSLPNGKIHRIHDDGSIPMDNPFVRRKGAYPSIYAYGNRNPQGLTWDTNTGVLWETEHGPKGGDELNDIHSGKNYGWPAISYGINYDGSVLTPYKTKPGMAQPASHWTPSIAVSGLDVYRGELFSDWNGRILAGSLANETIRLIEVNHNTYVSEAIILKGEGRVRQVKQGPDGAIYAALPSRIVRLSPKK